MLKLKQLLSVVMMNYNQEKIRLKEKLLFIINLGRIMGNLSNIDQVELLELQNMEVLELQLDLLLLIQYNRSIPEFNIIQNNIKKFQWLLLQWKMLKCQQGCKLEIKQLSLKLIYKMNQFQICTQIMLFLILKEVKNHNKFF